ncbi:MAG: hypothetical protein EBX52_04700 [Proteobacteria bacterium]|nr:hypothetical protein [Pseudomonadota bacterium]
MKLLFLTLVSTLAFAQSGTYSGPNVCCKGAQNKFLVEMSQYTAFNQCSCEGGAGCAQAPTGNRFYVLPAGIPFTASSCPVCCGPKGTVHGRLQKHAHADSHANPDANSRSYR